jgi:hypothetical protein
MTATFQTSFFAPIDNDFTNSNNRRNNRNSLRLFQVDVENFDNETDSFEIEAHSASEAAELAEERFGGDIYNMNIYEVLNF